jgi:hypothetical protein
LGRACRSRTLLRGERHYLGPEHVVLGVLAERRSGAAEVLRARGVELATARAELHGLARRGVVPPPRPSDAELLGTLGIDLDAIRRNTERSFGFQAVGEATWRVTRRRGWRGGRVVGPRCVACRWWPSARCSWPASRRVRLAMAKSGPSICCWESWRMPASPRTR